MSKKIRFTYEYTKFDHENQSGYCRFVVKYHDKIIIDFYTNGAYEGCFHFSDWDGTYKQSYGTCQFSMPTDHKAIIRTLRKMALESLAAMGEI